MMEFVMKNEERASASGCCTLSTELFVVVMIKKTIGILFPISLFLPLSLGMSLQHSLQLCFP